ncbi:MAG: XRE family transcriptional regulator [Methylocystis sp.]|nr:XRE family transcriptional regulator [Methylocystis sp.]MBI3275471.1 XRE family transcriptional regulator [Methylocystis sp.]
MSEKISHKKGTDNLFADIGLPNAEEHLVKAQLVYKIDMLLKERRLKQIEAARLFGVKQPDVSKMLHGDFRQFSVERLLRFLVALGQDVEIIVKPHRDAGAAPTLRVARA